MSKASTRKRARDLGIGQQMAVLAVVGAGGVQADQRDALAGLLEIDAVRRRRRSPAAGSGRPWDRARAPWLSSPPAGGAAAASRSLKYCRFCSSGRRSPSIEATPRLVRAKRSCQPGSGTAAPMLPPGLVGGADREGRRRASGAARARGRRERLREWPRWKGSAPISMRQSTSSQRPRRRRSVSAARRSGSRAKRSAGLIPAECTRSSIRRKP